VRKISKRIPLALILCLVALAAVTLSTPGVNAGAFVLHPRGFGTMSYSAWKAGEGLPDNKGTTNQAYTSKK
jgi:hypothetical protein